MSLALAANFVEKLNSVVPLAQNSAKNGLAIRVASAASDTLGTLTASGATSNVTWSISQNPSWVSLSVDPTTLIATLTFNNAQVQANAYQFFVTASDEATTQNFPIFLEVRAPFSLVASTGATSFSVPSYDSTVADIVFVGVGLNGVIDSGVQFIRPASLPAGFKFITSDGSSMKLRVTESGATNVAGGIALFSGSPVSTQVTLQAYKPGTMYDNPTRCYTQSFTIESLTAKQGVIDLGVTVEYSTTLNAFQLNAFVDFLDGQPQPLTYEWDVSGTATGNITSGGGPTSSTMVWTPATNGGVGFTVKVKNAVSGAVLAESIVSPTFNGVAGIPAAVSGSWAGTDAIKLSFSAPSARGYVGDTPTITLSTPAAELGAGETITVNALLFGGSALEGITPSLLGQPLTLTAAQPSVTIPLTIPSSSFNEKFIVHVGAYNAATLNAATRYSQATVVFESNGPQPLTINVPGGLNLTSNVGQSILPITLTSTNNAGATVTPVTYSLSGAPDGIFINSSGQLTGNVLIPGTYSFSLVAEAAGYGRSYSPALTLVASPFATPLSITDAVPSVAALPDNTQFNVSFGYSGTPLTLNLIQGFTVRSVLGSTEVSTSEVGSSVLTVFGTSFYGDAYSVPAIVLSSSVTAEGALPDAPTIGTIDENFNLTLNWTPLTVDGSYQAYRAWNIYLKQLPNGINTLQSVAGHLPTGLEVAGSKVDSRSFETQLTAGDWQVSMQALTSDNTVALNAAGWDQPHEFPTAITSGSATFDNQTISLGQTLTISLDPNYIGSDTWRAIYPDGTDSGWLPISVKSLAKALNIAGNLPIIIQTQRDYSKSNPAVKLIRQVTKSIYVMNQQYLGNTASDVLTGDLGFGGEGGFETTDASAGAVPLQPYQVIVRALVRDTISNELKLMVATSRTSNASSLLGTMAIDVFPLLNRPRVADLIDPAMYLTAEQSTPGNPVKIATTTLPNLIVGKPMADFPLQVFANSGVAPFSWYADNLPFGIKLSTNGTLSGTANTIGSSACDFSVVDSNDPPFIAHVTLTVTVESDLKITTTTLPQAVVGTPYNIPIVSTGGIPPNTWSLVAGSLPIGLSIDPNTGVIVGTPCTYNSTTDFNKTFTFTVQVVDAIGAIASAVLSCTLAPALLQFGNLDQPEIFADDAFEITLPIFGGTAPYSLVSFTDDGTIGTGLEVANPGAISVLAGINPPALTVTTNAQNFFPPSYPSNLTIPLSAQGGVAPYQFAVIPGSNSTLNSPAVFGSILTAVATGNGFFSAEVQVTDAQGSTATAVIQVEVQEQNAGAAGLLSIKPVSVALNGSQNPANWTVTPIAALPDAKNGFAYAPAAGSYYGLAVYNNNVLMMTQPAGSSPAPMNFTVREGALPNGIVAFSGNSFGQTTDYSGIVLFNVSGGQNATENGSYSFEVEFSNINWPGFNNPIVPGAGETVVSRESITVTTNGGGTTPVVVVTSGGNEITLISPTDLAPLGLVDQHYTLVSSADSSRPGPQAYVNKPSTVPSIAGAQWLSPIPYQNAQYGVNPGNYTFQTTFDLTGFNAATAQLNGQLSADNSVQIYLNGYLAWDGSTDTAYNLITAFSIASGFIAGLNTLQFRVTNSGSTPNPTGLQVQIAGTAALSSGAGVAAIPVYSTGIAAVDPHYTLVTSADPNYPGPSVFGVGFGSTTVAVGPNSASGVAANGRYTYQTTFDLTGLDPSTAVLTGTWSADDVTSQIFLNGSAVSNGPTPSNFTITSANPGVGFVAGVNTLQFFVVNNDGNSSFNDGGGSANPTTLTVQISGSANSPSGPQAIDVFGTGVRSVVSQNISIDLTKATGSPYTWYYPLTAEGGTGPYTFQIMGGTTLPGAAIATLNGLPALVSTTQVPEEYVALVTATDSVGNVSAPTAIGIQVEKTTAKPIHIVASNLPTTIFAGRALPANVYYIESDLLALFTATGLPAGLTLSTGPDTFAYLSGTPTATGNFTLHLTATSVLYNSTAMSTSALLIQQQTALFVNKPASAIVGKAYRTSTNNAIIQVQYTGYLPSDAHYPLPVSTTGTIGEPGILNNGVPTTSISNLTATGFTMSFDYIDQTVGNDLLSIPNNDAGFSLPVTYPSLTAVGTTVSSTVSEYSTTATFAPPVTVTGGLAPYTITPTGFSDSRFVSVGGQVSVSVASLTAGATVSSNVSLLVTDSSGQSTTATGVVQVTVRQEAFITVNFQNSTWAANVSSGAPFTLSLIPNQIDSVPQLGHAPYQYYVDSLTIPTGLGSFVQPSPSKRVLAINCNANSTSASIADVDANLQSSGTFVVAAVAPNAAPTAGSYVIQATLRVVDSKNLSASQVVTITLTIS